jgi:hypothetical protein
MSHDHLFPNFQYEGFKEEETNAQKGSSTTKKNSKKKKEINQSQAIIS